MTIWQWFRILISGQPHERIGGEANPYMLRWYVIPQNRFFKIFIHKFLRDDDDRAPHDHPWWFLSLMLKGMYLDLTPNYASGWLEGRLRRAGSIEFHRADYQHRVELRSNPDGTKRPCWTLVITGPKSRQWGFYCPNGYVPASKFDEKGCE